MGANLSQSFAMLTLATAVAAQDMAPSQTIIKSTTQQSLLSTAAFSAVSPVNTFVKVPVSPSRFLPPMPLNAPDKKARAQVVINKEI